MVAYWKINFGLRHLVPITDRYADTWFALMYGGKCEGGSLPLQFPFVSQTFLVLSPIQGANVAKSATLTSLLNSRFTTKSTRLKPCIDVLFIEVRVKNGEHFSRRVMENTGIRTAVVMRSA